MENLGGAILCVDCGEGKTVMAIYLSAILKAKTLVIVPTSPLMVQWKERIEEFSDAKIGKIQQNKIDVKGKDIVIGSLKSVANKDYPKDTFKDFEFVIYDECFPAKTKILTNYGYESILQLYNMYHNGKEILIKCYNEKTRKIEHQPMIFASRKECYHLVVLKIQDVSVKTTENHKFLTTHGYKEAKKLTTDDVLLSYNQKWYPNEYYNRIMGPTLEQIWFGLYLSNKHKICQSKYNNKGLLMTIYLNCNKYDKYATWLSKLFDYIVFKPLLINDVYHHKLQLHEVDFHPDDLKTCNLLKKINYLGLATIINEIGRIEVDIDMYFDKKKKNQQKKEKKIKKLKLIK